MASADFSLRERDRKRLYKDRLFRMAVSFGGVGVLAALVLIFVYLAMMVLPLFSSSQLEPAIKQQAISAEQPVAIGLNDYGEHAYFLSEDGTLTFWALDGNDNQAQKAAYVSHVTPDLFAQSMPALGWLGIASKQGEVSLFQPEFSVTLEGNKRTFDPEVFYFSDQPSITLPSVDSPVTQFAFTANEGSAVIVTRDEQDRVTAYWYEDEVNTHQFQFSQPISDVEQILLTPNGEQLYLRVGNDLIVAVQSSLSSASREYQVREIVTLGDEEKLVVDIALLSGAYSLLVSYQDGQVSQWFDVLTDGERTLTPIRHFKLASELKSILPDTYRKGFYSFYANGTVQSHYTTSEKLSLFERAFDKAPSAAAMSLNEKFLLTYSDGALSVSEVDNEYPEISFSSLWKKVWYESYPEPQFVWQTTSASDEFEAKFSLVPIAFGTLKAAFYAMLFAIPIAVLGAIYTAYFMSAQMRRVVKPSIELMEALPTVIIGFLAGLWFAPIVENHLAAVVSLLIFLPMMTVICGVVWHILPKAFTSKLPNGWHALILMPILAGTIVLSMTQSGNIEAAMFDGDIRLYFANHGFDFDQRNALVVGFAMGFAVIPTIFTIAEDAIFSVPKHLSDGSLALGATPWQTLIYVVLLTASPGIFSAIMMGLGRAVGETMIVLMATGNTPIMDWNILEGMRTLSATIAVEMPESEVGSSHFRLLFLAALLLLIFTFAVNSLAEWVRQRLREKYRAL
ncbi:ABC transporter permease subunit [Vibrio mexicanus]|uniref:ABC transporter permease subunit n=1 Tax=Vibrio mexicanus TaxID=1004326 RepID=UPI00063CC0F5|nr:ABC transporter permease subunit [Vibrio mexicanus]